MCDVCDQLQMWPSLFLIELFARDVMKDTLTAVISVGMTKRSRNI